MKVGDGPITVLGDGLLVYERGVILLPPAAALFIESREAGATLICDWFSSAGKRLPYPPVYGSGEVSVLPHLSTLVGVNLNKAVDPALVPWPAPTSFDTPTGWANYLGSVIDGSFSGQPGQLAEHTGSAAADDQPTDDEPPIGGPKPWWCKAFPSCPGC